jgi:5-methylcytosine-specific restriction endonuclease McrA
MNPSSHPTLVLNADYRPLSYYPLSLWSWQEAVKALVQGRVALVACYDKMIRSPSIEMPIPSVIALKEYQRLDRAPAFTRFNLFLRDEWTCQYCGREHPSQELTFDHVRPRSRGGATNWHNIVAACHECNIGKRDRTPVEAGMRLLRQPTQPTIENLNANGRRHPTRDVHRTWIDYLYWDCDIEQEDGA